MDNKAAHFLFGTHYKLAYTGNKEKKRNEYRIPDEQTFALPVETTPPTI